jgi:hypothetical protein
MPENPSIYDAIVIGSGISGGWAAKELCEKGLKTLLVERGRKVEHIKDYPTSNKAPWELPHRGNITDSFRNKNPYSMNRTNHIIAKKVFVTDGACMTSTGNQSPSILIWHLQRGRRIMLLSN